MKTRNMGMGLYIHIPFCVSKCSYCDFLSFECSKIQEQYVQALINEIRSTSNLTQIDTVYIGGGTPTALPILLLCKILQELQHMNIASDAEITVEMNPCTNSHSLMTALKSHGINRLSIGLQAWQDDLLKKIKRSHTSKDFADTIQAAKSVGINNINVDLMFGLPGQTMTKWKESISQTISYEPSHISTYSLTPAENTPLWDAIEAGDVLLPDEETDRDMYHEAIAMLTAAGYEHYELSNFSKPGKESQHNVDCWTRKPYLGLGLGAHSFSGDARWHNTIEMDKYLGYWQLVQPKGTTASIAQPFPSAEDYLLLSVQDAMAEFMFLGLRMTKGVSPQYFYSQFGKTLDSCFGNNIKNLVTRGLLVKKDGNFALSALGLDLANQVFESFV